MPSPASQSLTREPKPDRSVPTLELAPESAILDAARLTALRRIALLDSPTEQAFDRLTRLAASLLHAPVALVTLVDTERQFFKSSVGLAEPWASLRETPLSHSFCRHVVEASQPLVINDARQTPLVCDNPAIHDLNVASYLGHPLITSDGHALGSFCVMDSHPRVWTDADVAIVRDLADSVMTEIELRVELLRRSALVRMARNFVSLQDVTMLPEELLHETLTMLGADAAELCRWDEAAQALTLTHFVDPVRGPDAESEPCWISRKAALARHPVSTADEETSGPPTEHDGACIGVPLIHDSALIGVLAVHSRQPQFTFSTADLETLEIIAGLTASILERLEHAASLKLQAETDPLTGLANRRRVMDSFTSLRALADRQHQPLSLVMIDLDDFKTINDTHGHDAGDQVLRHIATLLTESFRSEDIVGRWGGDEFIVIMFGAHRHDAEHRLRSVLERAIEPILSSADSAGIMQSSFSAGVAEFPLDAATFDDLCQHADQRLYEAKVGGRGRVVG